VERLLFVALTVDVDPDANRPQPGRTDAVTAGAGGAVHVDGCRTGMHLLAGVLDHCGVQCTFFWESRTLTQIAESTPSLLERICGQERFEHGCHGLKHEDFSGAASGRALNRAETLVVVREASAIFSSVFGHAPGGFRAPYCRLTDDLAAVLRELRYRYDASLTGGPPLRPFALRGAEGGETLWEVPLCRWKDCDGRPISGYLWQLFEGRRTAESYLELAASLRERCPGGLLQIALHPWHLCVLEDGTRLTDAECNSNVEKLLSVIEGIRNLEGVRFCGLERYLDEFVRKGTVGD